ncbi:MAG TPA: hypothetical protein VNO32_53630 [Candidatus Acidoferrum sp.]|nr:hypothetical protein [Candidatus Acidoferrum sp.]
MSNFLDFATPFDLPPADAGAGQYDLPPKTTFYYKVESVDSSGRSDGLTSPIKTFTTQ